MGATHHHRHFGVAVSHASSVAVNGTDLSSTIVCYAPTMITTNGIWQGDNPLNYSLPLFILQLTLIVFTTRSLVILLKPLRQPRVVAEIIGGVLLGPSVLGRFDHFAINLFPLRSVAVLETMAHLGLLYFLFLVGVEMDLAVLSRTGRRGLIVAVSGMALPFAVGTSSSFLLKPHVSKNLHAGAFLLFLGVAVSVTAFPVLARILAELKLLNSELGRIAMSSALANDIAAWVLLALAIALTENDGGASNPLASLWVLLSGAAFVAFCFFALRPAVDWVIRRTPEGEPFNEFYICTILTGVMVCGLITDAIGIHSVFGAFIFGLVIPTGPLGTVLIEKLEDFVSGILLPLFFAISGLRTNLAAITNPRTACFLVLVILVAGAAKIAGTLLVALSYSMPFREGLSLGVLMNTKGLIEMIILNIGRDKQVLDEQSFAIMVVTSVLMTAAVVPVVTSVYRPARRLQAYKRRTLQIQRTRPDAELRMLACVHAPRNVPSIISLLEASNPTKRSPIFVYALHLVELTGRASAMLIVHNTASRSNTTKAPMSRAQAQSEHIVHAFENYEQHAGGVSVQPLTAISPHSTMYEDVCGLAEDKRVALIVLPFHKHQTVDGAMEAANPALRGVNQGVLAHAPCSVAVFVDRGLARGGPAHDIVMLFFGGPDDREALTYAWRMAEQPATRLAVFRFTPGDNAALAWAAGSEKDPNVLTVMTDAEREQAMDEELLAEFQMKNMGEESVAYAEVVANNGEETVAAIRSMEAVHDLYVVGRGRGVTTPLLSGLTDWSECPELGPIGDLLASMDFSAAMSVLVVQQYVGGGGDVVESPGRQQNYISRGDRVRRGPHVTGKAGWSASILGT
ncbi:Cation/H(+) antiporter 15 [Acorus gramineus]|uniref:Cation/H(+) antiporter 15 n=1 Tax=Acorus gramineus TaxID=55184 RepID=A0AAV9ATE0_ACOGR|nr:Cation/H(+) antiporter 15 [Acorus gramineus]